MDKINFEKRELKKVEFEHRPLKVAEFKHYPTNRAEFRHYPLKSVLGGEHRLHEAMETREQERREHRK